MGMGMGMGSPGVGVGVGVVPGSAMGMGTRGGTARRGRPKGSGRGGHMAAGVRTARGSYLGCVDGCSHVLLQNKMDWSGGGEYDYGDGSGGTGTYAQSCYQ